MDAGIIAGKVARLDYGDGPRRRLTVGGYDMAFSAEPVAAGAEIGVDLTRPSGTAGGRRAREPDERLDQDAGSLTGSFDNDPAEELAEIFARLGRVMRLFHVPVWLAAPLEALDGRNPIELIAAGDSEPVRRVISGLEDPGAL